jgi:hypothetical protein
MSMYYRPFPDGEFKVHYVYVNAITYSNNGASESATTRRFDIHQPNQSPDREAATPFTNQVNYDPHNRFGIIRFLDGNRVLAYSSNFYASETGGGPGDLRVSDNGSSRTVVLASNILVAAW